MKCADSYGFHPSMNQHGSMRLWPLHICGLSEHTYPVFVGGTNELFKIAPHEQVLHRNLQIFV